MADQDDVRTRVEDALRRAAATAYEAAHGAVEQRDDRGPARWRWVASPRVAVTAVLAVALVGALIAFLPRDQARAPTTLESASMEPAAMENGAGQPTELSAPVAADAESVTVHVAGAVKSAGVYVLPAGSRVADAVDAAGGAVDDADTDSVNLARVLIDGEQVKVAAIGEVSDQGTSDTLVNLNSSDAATLERLPGVGPVLAQRIVEYREQNGPFASIDALDSVSGVGPTVLEKIRAAATV